MMSPDILARAPAGLACPTTPGGGMTVSHNRSIHLAVLSCLLFGGCTGQRLGRAPEAAYAKISADAFQQHVRFLADPASGGRLTGTPGNIASGFYIANAFRDAGLRPAGDEPNSYFQAFAATGDVFGAGLCPARNVIGLLPSDLGEVAPFIVIGAHYDHLDSGGVLARDKDKGPGARPGADDNASGVAGMLMLARAMAATPNRNCHYLFIAFDAEEVPPHFQGSRHFVANLPGPRHVIAAMINLDQIGRVGHNRVLMMGLGVMSREMEAVRAAAKRDPGLKIVHVPLTSKEHWSDQAPFAKAGIRTLFFYDGNMKTYHTMQDTPDSLNNRGGAQVTRLVYEVLRNLDAMHAPKPTK